MAEAAADGAVPDLPNEQSEDQEFESAEPVSGAMDDEDDEDPVRGGRKAATADENGEPVEEEPLADDDDLFGDGGDDEEPALEDEEPEQRRELDDEELDSGDDLGRNDRTGSAPAEEAEEQEEQIQTVQDVSLPRHAVPDPSDNEIYLARVPKFFSIEPKCFDREEWQPPTADHHEKEPSANFSAYKTAQTTVRWRYSPSDPTKLQSNARILRWSDGSLTLQLGSDPTTQYEIDAKGLAPPQRNPLKPTPNMERTVKGGPARYDPSKDTFTFLTAPAVDQQVMRITNKVTTALQFRVSNSAADDALEKLQENLARAAALRRGGDIQGGVQIANLKEDPEKKKKESELAEKQLERAARTQARAAERRQIKLEEGPRGSGRSRTFGAGLTAAGLEGDDMGTGRSRGRGYGKPKRKEYDDDSEEDYRHKRNREDSYDEEDDFIAGSDEEEEVGEEDEDEDEGIQEVEERPARRASPKRPRPSGGAADEDDDDAPAGPAGKRRRRVIDEDEEEE